MRPQRPVKTIGSDQMYVAQACRYSQPAQLYQLLGGHGDLAFLIIRTNDIRDCDIVPFRLDHQIYSAIAYLECSGAPKMTPVSTIPRIERRISY